MGSLFTGLKKRPLAALLLLFALLSLCLWRGSLCPSSTLAPSPCGVRTEEDRQTYLLQWGWLVGPQPLCVEELRLPDSFGEPYQDFLALQQQQGFTQLERYTGKVVRRYTYSVQNAPGLPPLQVRLLLRGSRVLAGEVIGEGIWQGLSPAP